MMKILMSTSDMVRLLKMKLYLKITIKFSEIIKIKWDVGSLGFEITNEKYWELEFY